MGGGKDFGGFGNKGGFDRGTRPDAMPFENGMPQMPDGEMPEMNGLPPQMKNNIQEE